MKRTSAAVLAGALIAGTAGCSSSDTSSSDTNSSTGSSSSASAKHGTITVLAAASLTEVFNTLKAKLEKENPGLTIKVSYAASSTIVQQVNNGADADVVALADTKTESMLDKKVTNGRNSTIFATNRLEIATPANNPAHVANLSSLSTKSVKTVLCAAEVPCGRAAKTVLGKAHVTPNVISYEANVKATLSKVRLGEADAAVVYATDVKSAGKAVHGVPISDAQNVITQLPILALTDSPDAKLFVDAVTSASGRSSLTSYGFGAP